ncbi:MAG: ABC transporter permease [Steroidobacteraceae bacterium]|nr:ABC transporter permease [Steroidobacteraceae bacterium]
MSPVRAFFQRVGAIAAKEVRQLRRDRLTGAMVVGIPLIQILIFGYGINLDVRHIRAGVVDYADTSASRALVSQLEASQVVQFVHRAPDVRELRRALAAGDISAGLYIPPDFERRRLEAGRPIAQVLIDGSEPGIEAALRALASMPLRLRAADYRAPERPLEVLTEYNPERRTAVQIVPALIGVILNMTMVIFTAIALVRERERGNLELLITTPVKPVELMIGKLAPYVVVGLIQTTIVLATGVLLFDVPINGPLWQLYAGASLFIAATLALGLVISTVAQTQFQAMQLGFFTMLPSILLSGFMFPLAGMPRAAQWLAQILPLTHFNSIVRGVILRGAALQDLTGPLLKLTAFLVVAVTIAALRFRKRLG